LEKEKETGKKIRPNAELPKAGSALTMTIASITARAIAERRITRKSGTRIRQ
jgi:hypothetical protein